MPEIKIIDPNAKIINVCPFLSGCITAGQNAALLRVTCIQDQCAAFQARINDVDDSNIIGRCAALNSITIRKGE